MCVSLEVEGIDTMSELLVMLREIGTTVNGAQLRGAKRVDAEGTSNDDILAGLVLSGRDFVGPTDGDINAAADSFSKTVQTRLEKFARSRRAKKLGAKSIEELKALQSIGYAKDGSAQRLAQEIASASLKEAIFTWMDAIMSRIENQQTATGGLTPLSETYAAYKRKKWGFESPIGKASGQLLDNLDSSGTGERNVRITRDKNSYDQMNKAFIRGLRKGSRAVIKDIDRKTVGKARRHVNKVASRLSEDK